MSDTNNPNIGFYTPLSEKTKVRTGEPTDVPVDPTTRKFTAGFVERTIDSSSVSDAKARSAFKDRVEGRMLLLTNPYKNKQSKQGRISSSNKITKKTGRKSITAKERRASKIYDIPKEAHRYELFIPLYEMWSRYIESLMGGKPLEEMNADSKQRQMMLGRLIKADMHGAVMAVDRAKCPNYIGIKGIVAQETKNVFKIITKEDRLVTVPKAHCVFMLELPSGLQCQIYGNQFAFRASERASKKFKPKPTVEL